MKRVRNRWSKAEKQIAMEQRLRAQTIPSKKKEPPSLDEWDYEEVKLGMNRSTMTTTVGNGVSTQYTVAHLLGTKDIEVYAYDQSGQMTLIDYESSTFDAVKVNFMYAPKPGEFTVEVTRKKP